MPHKSAEGVGLDEYQCWGLSGRASPVEWNQWLQSKDLWIEGESPGQRPYGRSLDSFGNSHLEALKEYVGAVLQYLDSWIVSATYPSKMHCNLLGQRSVEFNWEAKFKYLFEYLVPRHQYMVRSQFGRYIGLLTQYRRHLTLVCLHLHQRGLQYDPKALLMFVVRRSSW